MSNAIAWADLKARVAAAGIALGGVPLPIYWPNAASDELPTTTAPWLQVEMVGGSARPIELGGSIWEAQGQSLVHVLVPTGGGIDDAMSLVDQVAAMFRAPPLSPVVYAAVSCDPGGPGTDDGLYWRTSVTADWRLQTFVPRS